MKILFTGGSSFTGYWFIRALAEAGHEVVAIFRKRQDEYEGLRQRRVAQSAKLCQPVFACSFGTPEFLKLIAGAKAWDLFCHHAAEAANYKRADFDFAGALANNTHNLQTVCGALFRKGCRGMVLTGSVFEFDEGQGEEPRRAFSPYGVSKGLTAKVFEYYAVLTGLPLGKFVIPNPFGPYEEPRFTSYLAKAWLAGTTPAVSAPDYVRDNIHVTLLAKAYTAFAAQVPGGPAFQRLGPSGYVESQGVFAQRFAAALRPRLKLPCPLELKPQADFSEPLSRHNTDVCDAAKLGWDEASAWDELARYYCEAFRGA